MLAFAAIGAFNPPSQNAIEQGLMPHEIEKIKKYREIWLKQRELEIKKKRGLKEFEIEGVKILALNYKNAIRKFNRFKKAEAVCNETFS